MAKSNKQLTTTGIKFICYVIIVISIVCIDLQNTYCLPVYQSVIDPGPFEKLKDIPQSNRVDSASEFYKVHFRKAASSVAMAKLDDLTAIARSLKDKSLECAVYNMRADYYSVNIGFNPLSTAYYQQAIDFAIANKMLYENGLYQQALGRYYFIFNKYALACQCYLKSKEIFNQIGYSNIPGISNYLSNIADLYYAVADYDNARIYLEIALKYAPPGTRAQINITNTIGLIYRNYSRFPKSLNYFNKALKLSLDQRDTIWIGIVQGNIGSVYFLQNQYKKALPYIETDYKTSIGHGEYLNGLIALLRLIEMNINLKNFELAGTQLKEAEKLLITSKDDVLGQWAVFYSLKSKLDEQLGKTVEAISYRKKFELADISLAKRNNIVAVERVQLQFEIDKRTTELNQLKADKKIQSVEINATIIVLILLTIISALIYNRQRLKGEKDKELLLAEKRIVDEELKNSELSLNVFTENLRQKNVLIEDFKQEIDRLNLKITGNADAEHLAHLLQAHIMTDENWSSFKTLFSKVYPSFFIYLTKNYNQFSPSEMRILALIKLGLNNTEMANMLGITVEGIKKAKQRLRKKIDINMLKDIENQFDQ